MLVNPIKAGLLGVGDIKGRKYLVLPTVYGGRYSNMNLNSSADTCHVLPRFDRKAEPYQRAGNSKQMGMNLLAFRSCTKALFIPNAGAAPKSCTTRIKRISLDLNPDEI
jgi:hypothetical protein